MDMLKTAGRAALAPFWTAALLTGAKSFVDNPIIGSPWLNERGLHVARIRLAAGLARWRRRPLASLVSPEDRAAYERDGFVLKPDFLPPEQFAALDEQVRAWRGMARETGQGDTITRRIALSPPVLARMPAVDALLRTPSWRGLIRYIAGRGIEPLNYVQTILPKRTPAPPDPQLSLHADTFHATAKAWLFLTEVDEAPFVYVPGSHRMTEARLAWERRVAIGAARSACRLTSRGSFRIAEAELAGLGLPPPRQFRVPANTLIVADTSGFHARGPSNRATMRVEIWGYSRTNPFAPWNGFDPWRHGGIGDFRAEWYWRAADWLQQAGLRPNVWKEYAGRSAFDD